MPGLPEKSAVPQGPRRRGPTRIEMFVDLGLHPLQIRVLNDPGATTSVFLSQIQMHTGEYYVAHSERTATAIFRSHCFFASNCNTPPAGS